MLPPDGKLSQFLPMSLALSFALGLGACSTIPDKAPSEYHLASAAIERADESKAAKAFPITMERAKSDLKQALNLFYQSQDNDTPEPTRQAVARAGATKAEEAKSLAEKAIDLHAQVNAWDQRIEAKEEAEQAEAALSTLQNKIVALDEEAEERMMAFEQSDLMQSESELMPTNVQTPVAFFATDETGLSNQFTESMDTLATTLNNNPSLKVTLIGYADHTGQPNRNNVLAEKRAENVAKALRGRGVMADQILIDSKGSAMTASNSGDKGINDLQMDRRVDALLSKRSGMDRERMTTGR